MKTNLSFEPRLLAKIMYKLTEGRLEDGVNMVQFTKFLMGSQATDASSGHSNTLHKQVSADSGNSEMMIKRKIRMSWRGLNNGELPTCLPAPAAAALYVADRPAGCDSVQ